MREKEMEMKETRWWKGQGYIPTTWNYCLTGMDDRNEIEKTWNLDMKRSGSNYKRGIHEGCR